MIRKKRKNSSKEPTDSSSQARERGLEAQLPRVGRAPENAWRTPRHRDERLPRTDTQRSPPALEPHLT